MKRNPRKTLFFVLYVLLLLTTAVPSLLAHGGGLIYVAGEAAGAYRVTVWVAPDEVEVGKTLHFTVAVVEAESNDMLLDAEVGIEVRAADSGELVLSGPATTAQSVNKLFYEADFPEAPEAGTYTAVTTVNGRYGTSDISFEFDVVPAKTAINWLYAGIGGLIVIVVIGFFLSSRSPKPT